MPAYMADLPDRDPWGHELHYESWRLSADQPAPQEYGIASAGSDGRWEENSVRLYRGAFTDPRKYGSDIVYREGEFIRRAEE